MSYFDLVEEKCIECGKCTKNCDFLKKYDLNLKDYVKRDDLKYSCFLCGKCNRVCPVDLDGRIIAQEHRKGEERGFTLMKMEKSPYIFRNNSKKKSDTLLFLGCSFPRQYPETSKKLVEIFEEKGIDFSLDCCGKPVFETGDMKRAKKDKKRLEEIFKKKGVKRIVTACMNCYYFFKANYDIEVVSVYHELKELGLGRKVEEEKNIFVPCPDRKTLEVLEEIKYFVPNLNTPFEDVQCCGLGGLAISREPEIADGFIKKLKSYDKPITTYCASCSSRFRRADLNLSGHILCDILNVKEIERLKFLSGSLELRNFRRSR
ncbi:(Fe-S)-binding protein [Lagierella sp.]|uniref:(Fe-S)-binding protein n=1 Tax=Lagierella sp. TaxID=2849657 RepID=UPI0026102366|nr:(Fe-S)-binding protein [Lagierella sp.]